MVFMFINSSIIDKVSFSLHTHGKHARLSISISGKIYILIQDFCYPYMEIFIGDSKRNRKGGGAPLKREIKCLILELGTLLGP